MLERLKNGRANAEMTIASAKQRSASRRMCRSFWRLTERYGIRCRNISEGNSMTSLRSRWMRWISTGIASAASPAKKRGARKLISANPLQPLARGQIRKECVVERLRRIEQRVIDAAAGEHLGQR